MDPPLFKAPPTESRALHPLSPERVNGLRTTAILSKTGSKTIETESQSPNITSTHSSPTRKANLFADYLPASPSSKASGFGLPPSPSLPEIYTLRGHVRTNSDVQGLVKRFEHLDVRDRDAESAERRKKHEAELRRAQIAREEAESDVKRLREEVRRLKKEGDESRDRERRVGKRLEVLMEEIAGAKETQATQTAVYEKELRKARKEAFKSSSAVLKLQEDLKTTRNGVRATQANLELEKQKLQRRDQETFSAQYQLIAVQEELDKLNAHLKIVEEEKAALKTNLKDEEVARIAAQGMIALPVTKEDAEYGFCSPRKQSPLKRAPSPLSDDKENLNLASRKALENKGLEEELAREQMRREHAEEMIDFLQMECMFRCCSCKTASRHGREMRTSLSEDIQDTLLGLRAEMREVLAVSTGSDAMETLQMDFDAEAQTESLEAERQLQVETEAAWGGAPSQVVEADDIELDDRTETMMAESPAPQISAVEQTENQAPLALPTTSIRKEGAMDESMDPSLQQMDHPSRPLTPQTPPPFAHATASRNQNSIRTVTTTTTIPMQFTPAAKQPPLSIDDAPQSQPQDEQDGTIAPPPAFDRAAALAAIQYRRGRAKSIADGHMTPRKQMIEGVNVKERRDISAPALGGKAGLVGPIKGAASVGRATGRRMV